MEKLEFKTTIEDVIRLFGPEGIIYSQDHTVFLRELLQNSMDSIEIQKQKEGTSDFQGRILIEYDDSRITITDNGWGLDRDGVVDHFARPLRGIQRYLQTGARGLDNIIGHFGVGFLSVFKVSDYVEIETRRKGCRGLAVNMGLKRNFVRGKSDLALQSFVSETDRGMERGMKVAVYLGSADSDTNRRAELMDSGEDVLEALNRYAKHPPGDIDILFEYPKGIKNRIESVPFRGLNADIHHKISIEGMEGVLAYSMGLENPVLQVCQRGLLVKENYPTLLPESTGAIVGEINLLRTDLMDLALSRESFLENEKYERLRSLLSSELYEFDRKFKESMEKKIARADAAPKKKFTVREDSQHATALLEAHHRGIQKNIYHHKICSEITFHVETEDEYRLLPEIAELAQSKGVSTIYVYEKELKYLQLFMTFDEVDYYTYEKNKVAAVEYLKEQGKMVIRLTKREEGSKLSFMEIVTKYLENSGLGVEELEPGRIIQSEEDLPPLHTERVELKVVDLKKSPKRKAFVHKFGSWSGPIVYLNKANAQVRDIMESSHHIETETGELLIKAYIYLMAGELENVANIIHNLVMRDRPQAEEHESREERHEPAESVEEKADEEKMEIKPQLPKFKPGKLDSSHELPGIIKILRKIFKMKI